MTAGRMKRRKHHIETDENGDQKNEELSYCTSCYPFCLQKGDAKLRPRLLHKGEKKAHDYDKWLQCYNCGRLVPRYAEKKENKLVDFVKPLDNPHDMSKGKPVALFERRSLRERAGGKLAVSRPIDDPSVSREEMERLRERLHEIKDPELRSELTKGHILVDYQNGDSNDPTADIPN